eukprot:TRINITY_DN67080_c5_g2_i1.p1 TRINITY_DN67080_c5_g2~~TRINITY_DN67080_c5_g2_i1.p1  ORF type:complete len:246 (+),score=59.70 TRINITY_DN67080_c5_g2_i1:96-833(+)
MEGRARAKERLQQFPPNVVDALRSWSSVIQFEDDSQIRSFRHRVVRILEDDDPRATRENCVKRLEKLFDANGWDIRTEEEQALREEKRRKREAQKKKEQEGGSKWLDAAAEEGRSSDEEDGGASVQRRQKKSAPSSRPDQPTEGGGGEKKHKEKKKKDKSGKKHKKDKKHKKRKREEQPTAAEGDGEAETTASVVKDEEMLADAPAEPEASEGVKAEEQLEGGDGGDADFEDEDDLGEEAPNMEV